MIITIPLGGIGKRFKDYGFDLPKALIKIYNKPLIFYLIDNLGLSKIDFIYISYNKEYTNYDFENILIKQYPVLNLNFFNIIN